MRGDGGRADIDGEAERLLVQAGPEADDLAAVADGAGDLPFALAQRLLQQCERLAARRRAPSMPPLLLERLLRAGGNRSAGSCMSGSAHLDIVERDHRIDGDRRGIGGALAHHLAVDLAVRRDVDDDIAAELGLAAEAAARGAARPRLAT